MQFSKLTVSHFVRILLKTPCWTYAWLRFKLILISWAEESKATSKTFNVVLCIEIISVPKLSRSGKLYTEAGHFQEQNLRASFIVPLTKYQQLYFFGVSGTCYSPPLLNILISFYILFKSEIIWVYSVLYTPCAFCYTFNHLIDLLASFPIQNRKFPL